MRRRGMTLLEVMVVLAIVVALASVAAPAVWSWSKSARLPEAGNTVEAAMMTARAESQRASAPVRVVARMGLGGMVEVVTQRVALDAKPDEGEPERPVPARSVWTLPRGVSVSERTSESGGAARAAAEPSARDAEGSADAGILIAVFLPDGEAVRPGPRYLVDDSGRTLEVGVEALSGRIIVRPIGVRPIDSRAASTGDESPAAHAGEEQGMTR